MKSTFFLLFLSFSSCHTGNLKVIADLPHILKEVSGTEIINDSNSIWMLNDSGNTPKLYELDSKGKLIKELVIKAKNKDWEDLTSDKAGNLYIGDFGNNNNKRKNLSILKIKAKYLKGDTPIAVEYISFKYPNQTKFPPKKKNMHFDCEAFFHFNDSLYLFTKSRVKSDFGKTNLYKIPAEAGNYNATFISTFKAGNELGDWITSADISSNGKKVVLLSPNAAWVFTDFYKDDFFNGNSEKLPFDYHSQKEGVCFKNENNLYITDEKSNDTGGNLYQLKLKQ